MLEMEVGVNSIGVQHVCKLLAKGRTSYAADLAIACNNTPGRTERTRWENKLTLLVGNVHVRPVLGFGMTVMTLRQP